MAKRSTQNIDLQPDSGSSCSSFVLMGSRADLKGGFCSSAPVVQGLLCPGAWKRAACELTPPPLPAGAGSTAKYTEGGQKAPMQKLVDVFDHPFGLLCTLSNSDTSFPVWRHNIDTRMHPTFTCWYSDVLSLLLFSNNPCLEW